MTPPDMPFMFWLIPPVTVFIEAPVYEDVIPCAFAFMFMF